MGKRIVEQAKAPNILLNSFNPGQPRFSDVVLNE